MTAYLDRTIAKFIVDDELELSDVYYFDKDV